MGENHKKKGGHYLKCVIQEGGFRPPSIVTTFEFNFAFPWVGGGTAPPGLPMGDNHKKGDTTLSVSSKNGGFRAPSDECADAIGLPHHSSRMVTLFAGSPREIRLNRKWGHLGPFK